MSVAICRVASVRALVAERDLGLLDHGRDAVAPELERELQVGLRVGELVRGVEALRLG